jgi:glycosyltransferase involved in cell wall biosynthesis
VIHNGVPIREPEPVPRAAQPTILFAGRLAPEKGCQILLPALQRVAERAPEAKLLIAGAGPYRRTLEALCAELRLVDRVTFLGHLDQAALRAYTRRAWLQVVPSLWDEPFGVAALDAMVQARPVIASASGGLREIVEDGVSGLLAAPGDVAALAARMSELLLDAGRCETMGAAGRTRLVERFSIARCVDDFLALYARLSSS